MNQEKGTLERMYRPKEAAPYVGGSHWKVIELCKTGALGFHWIGKRRLISESQLKAYLSRCEVKPRDEAA